MSRVLKWDRVNCFGFRDIQENQLRTDENVGTLDPERRGRDTSGQKGCLVP